MLDKLLKYIPVTTAIILYLYLCGGLYLIGFWTTFDVDILNLVSITEIPKSFILPFTVSVGVLLISVFIFTLIMYDKEIHFNFLDKIENTILIKSKTHLMYKIDFWLILISILIIVLYHFCCTYSSYWLFAGCGIVFLMIIKIISFPSFIKFISFSKILLVIFILSIFTPATSFVMGKVKSLTIYNNEKIKCIKNIIVNNNKDILAQKDSLSFKSLGFLGDKFIISSLDNREIIILNQSSIEQIDFIEKK